MALTAFDVVLMDMQMPVMDGLSATRAIRAIELDDQPGPLRDTLKASQVRWAKVLKREFRTLNPNADDAALEVLVFQLKGIVLAYGHSRRLLDDEAARAQVTAAYRMLVASASRS